MHATTQYREDEGRLLGLIMQYEHPELVHRIATENGWSAEEAYEVFTDTKRFLYLCSLYKGLAPSPRIDIGWHTFLLYTKDYASFCDAFFGRFIHHQPVLKLSHSIRNESSIPQTRSIALATFGTISENWWHKGACTEPNSAPPDDVKLQGVSCHNEKCGSDSEDGCQAGDIRAEAACSMADCTPVSCEHR